MHYDLLVVNILATMFHAINIVFMGRTINNKKNSLFATALFVAVFSLINGLSSYLIIYLNESAYLAKSITIFIVSVILIKLILKHDFKRSFILFGIYSVILLISESSLYLAFRMLNILSPTGIWKTFLDSVNNIIIGNVFICLFSFIIVLIIRFFKSYLSFPKNVRTIVLTIAISFLIIASNMWAFYYNFNNNTSVVIFGVVTLLTLLYSIYIIFNINISYKLERQSVELEQQKFYNSALDKTLDNFRRFKHGYNNNLNVLYALARSGENEKLVHYFNEVMELNSRLNDTVILNIKNAGLYGVISSKIQYADEFGVDFKIKAVGEIQDIKNIRMSDLCEIIGILLDNAIEAACESASKEVSVNITEEDENIHIMVMNSFAGTPDLGKIFLKGFSSKGEGRGMGLWIINEILKNNRNVLINTSIKGNMFFQELTIKKGR